MHRISTVVVILSMTTNSAWFGVVIFLSSSAAVQAITAGGLNVPPKRWRAVKPRTPAPSVLASTGPALVSAHRGVGKKRPRKIDGRRS
jgi:hypothetical protein